ncbi:MAG: hypothetical protein LUQ11_07750 [Methylococcaceae bacterium]|nr:hypothetical protein [Methylococcaceae bacterium]
MTDNKRSHEASTLRTFFDDQIQHLHDLVNSHILHEEPQIDEDQQIVDSFVDAANRKMRAVHGYAEKLREHVCELYHHVLRVAEQIPPPLGLTRDAFAANQIVNALFINSDDIDRLFQRNPEVESYLRTRDQYQMPIVYALLTACKSEKNTLGVGMLGDLLVRDVPQRTVNFHAHKIHIPSASSEELSTALRHYLFDRVVALIKQEMASRMTGQAFESGDRSYESRIRSLANPDVYLNTLIEYLEIPASLLSIEKSHYKLSKLGIKLENGDGQCANEFDIHEITWSDGTRNVVLQIAYSR